MKIVNNVSNTNVPAWGNTHEFICIHYLGCVGEGYDLAPDGTGAHYYIYYDGTIRQRCSHDAVPWAVGTADGQFKQKHPKANNYNTISIEMCVKKTIDYGASNSAYDTDWFFTKETQEACVWLVKKLMKDLNIPADHVLRHYDIVNKWCPAPYCNNKKYNGTWTWEEFKSKLGAETIKDELVCGMYASDVAKVVMAEFGIASGRNYDCLLGVAQCMKDMLDHGGYGDSLLEVLKNNFTYPAADYTDDCMKAVIDVFKNGKLRFVDKKILQFRSFKNYGDGKGNPDPLKCKILMMNHKYLGCDSISSEYGHFYFGISNEPKYRVQVGAFSVKENAEKLRDELIKKGYTDAFIRE